MDLEKRIQKCCRKGEGYGGFPGCGCHPSGHDHRNKRLYSAGYPKVIPQELAKRARTREKSLSLHF